MKKVLFVSHTANFSKFNRLFMRWFREQQWEVSYASAEEERILECDYSYKISFERSPFSMKNIKAYRQLKTLIETKKFDIIHCHTPVGGVLTRLAARCAKGIDSKVLYTGHGLHFYKGASKINWLIYYPIEKLCAKFTDCLITINTEDYENVRKFRFKAKIIEYVHGVGVSLERFYPRTHQQIKEIREEYGYSSQDVILICIAELNKNKNQKFLINAMRELKKRIPDIKLMIVGMGDENAALKQQAYADGVFDIVSFMGYRQDIEKLLAISNVLVTASYREGLPVNIMEAMASGLPIVCTDVRGQRDLVHNGRNGYLYEVDHTDSFCEKIELLINDFKKYEEIAKNNVKDVQIYSSESVIKEMARIYRRYM